MNTNNLYEKVNQTENQINYEELYGRNDKKNNPEQIFNTRFNEGLNILRQPIHAQSSTLDKNQIFNNDNNYDATKNYYNRYQNNFINQSLMNCEEASGVGNFAAFKPDPNANNFINSLTNNPQHQHEQQLSRQQQQQQQQQQQHQHRHQQQQQQQQNQQQQTQQKCVYCISQMQNRK